MENKNYKFEMGQIIYLLPKNSNQIVPAIVQEEIVKRSLGGILNVSYTVMLGSKGKQKIYPIDKVDGDVFESIEQAKMRFQEELELMNQKYIENVNKICDDAINKAKNWYGDMNFENQSLLDPNKIDPSSFLNDENEVQNATIHHSSQENNINKHLMAEKELQSQSDNILLSATESTINKKRGK